MASRILARASASVSPSDQQPGKPGTQALTLSSVCSRKVTYGAACSLDGFIASMDDGVDWLRWSDDVLK